MYYLDLSSANGSCRMEVKAYSVQVDGVAASEIPTTMAMKATAMTTKMITQRTMATEQHIIDTNSGKQLF
jgi:hypothetical protein